jgi:DNA-binding XRE family transcriptional regulator
VKLSKRKKLERAGFKVGTVREFLRLSDGEMALIDLKVRLIEMLATVRKQAHITQHELAKIIGSSQSRVAKMEAGGSDVSLDLICKALFALGASRRDIGKMIASKRAA